MFKLYHFEKHSVVKFISSYEDGSTRLSKLRWSSKAITRLLCQSLVTAVYHLESVFNK